MFDRAVTATRLTTTVASSFCFKGKKIDNTTSRCLHFLTLIRSWLLIIFYWGVASSPWCFFPPTSFSRFPKTYSRNRCLPFMEMHQRRIMLLSSQRKSVKLYLHSNYIHNTFTLVYILYIVVNEVKMSHGGKLRQIRARSISRNSKATNRGSDRSCYERGSSRCIQMSETVTQRLRYKLN